MCTNNERDKPVVTWTSSGMSLQTRQGGKLDFKNDGVFHYFEGMRTSVPVISTQNEIWDTIKSSKRQDKKVSAT